MMNEEQFLASVAHRAAQLGLVLKHGLCTHSDPDFSWREIISEAWSLERNNQPLFQTSNRSGLVSFLSGMEIALGITEAHIIRDAYALSIWSKCTLHEVKV